MVPYGVFLLLAQMLTRSVGIWLGGKDCIVVGIRHAIGPSKLDEEADTYHLHDNR